MVVSRLVVLFAKTGTGKTSLINAGVRPRLRDQGYTTYFIRVRRDPYASACEELERDKAVGPLGEAPFIDQLRTLVKRLGKRPVVLFFDQFEEFFLYGPDDPAKMERFIADVAEAYRDEALGIQFVFSMREEFFVEMDAFRDKIPTIFHNESNLRLRWFTEKQARDAMVKPARAGGNRRGRASGSADRGPRRGRDDRADPPANHFPCPLALAASVPLHEPP